MTGLVTMDIDTGDIPPISQKLYTLSLKQATQVQKELELFGKAGITVSHISP